MALVLHPVALPMLAAGLGDASSAGSGAVVIQEFVNHGGLQYKAYAIGNRVGWGVHSLHGFEIEVIALVSCQLTGKVVNAVVFAVGVRGCKCLHPSCKLLYAHCKGPKCFYAFWCHPVYCCHPPLPLPCSNARFKSSTSIFAKHTACTRTHPPSRFFTLFTFAPSSPSSPSSLPSLLHVLPFLPLQVFYATRTSIPDVTIPTSAAAAAAAAAGPAALERFILRFDSLSSLPTQLPDHMASSRIAQQQQAGQPYQQHLHEHQAQGSRQQQRVLDQGALEAVAGYIGSQLGLALFGFDIVVSTSSGEWLVVVSFWISCTLKLAAACPCWHFQTRLFMLST